jgi:AcrR family transcriptional regulator
MLHSAVAIIAEDGYGRMSVARVTNRARVSRRTFYDVFNDREDCFLAAFDSALARVEERVRIACEGVNGGWRERTRAGLGAVLVCLDEQPGMRSLLVFDPLSAGPRVLKRRGEVLKGLGVAVQDGAPRSLPPLIGEGVIGAVFGLVHARLLTRPSGSLLEQLSVLMGVIVLAFEGPVVAEREMARPVPKAPRVSRKTRTNTEGISGDLLEGLDMRLTYRTLRVLTTIVEQSAARGGGLSNREVAQGAGISDQGQVSKLLARLQRLELIENTAFAERPYQPTGEPNAWRLTPRGEGVVRDVI